MNDTGKLIKNTTIYAIGDIIPKIFGFITFPILTNAIAPDEYGILNYINSIDIFLVAAGLLCLNTYYLVYYFRVGGDNEKRKLLGNLSIFIVFNYIIIALILFIFGPSLFRLIGSKVDFYPYIAIGIATAFFSILTVLPSALYRVKENPFPLTIINVIRGFLVMVLTILSVYLLEPNALNVLWARFIATAFFGMIFVYITFKNATFSINITQLRHALAFSLPLVPATLATYLYSMFDKVLIEKYLTLSALGIYSTASTLAFLLNIISHGAYKAFEPHIFKTYGTPSFDSSFGKVRDILLFVVLMGGLFICGYSEEFLKIFSSTQYESARYYIPMLTIGAVASAMSLMYGTIVTARGKTKVAAVITIVGAILSVVLDIILLRFWGIWAAAFVSMFSFIFLCYGNMLYAHVKVDHVRPLFGVFFASLSMYMMTFIVHVDTIVVSFIVKLLIIIISCFVIMLVLGLNIKKLIKSLINKS